jgi:sulfotransferase family protein
MLPNFIVIGAAKAGTTALYWYLAEHPEVFMSPVKETNYFAYGLDAQGQLLYGDPDVHRFPVKSLDDYERLFADAGGAVAIGEASPIYLESPQAAARIRQLLPHTKLICILRHPVDRAYSDYQMYLLRRGRRFDPARELTVTSAWARPDSRWMQVSRYHAQLQRYFDAFPPGQIQVILFDDLKRGALQVVQSVYRFLGVDSAFAPDFDAPHNVGGLPESRLLEGLLTSRALRLAVEPWIPSGAANWIRRVRMKNMRQAPALPPELRKELTGHFRDDIAKTSALVGRSLAHWLEFTA